MNLPQLDRKTMTLGAMFIAPILAVQFGLPLHRVMGKPQAASANPVNTEMPVVAAPPTKPTDAQVAAAEYMQRVRTQPTSLDTPFYYPPKTVEVHDAPVEISRGTPQFRITSILEARDGRVLAMINGKMCAVGAAPVEGWTINAIDAAAKTVTVRADDDSEELVLTLRQRSK